MPTFAKNGGSWRKLKEIHVKDGGSWRRIQRAWVRTGAGWQLIFRRAFAFSETLSATTTKYDLRARLIAAGWDQTTPVEATVTINSGTYLVSDSTSNYALSVLGSYPSGSTIRIINYGMIVGYGGAGGKGGTASSSPGAGSNGQPGGTAVRIEAPVTFVNWGTIGAGGGGGGGGGAVWGSDAGGSGTSGGGGGGGRGGAAAGSSGGGCWRSSKFRSWQSSGIISNYSCSAAGSGGQGYRSGHGAGGGGGYQRYYSAALWWNMYGGVGGRGGGLGQWGASGNRGSVPDPSPFTRHVSRQISNGGAGGPPGDAVHGNRYITWEILGSRIGSLVN